MEITKSSQQKIATCCDQLKEFLIAKNKAYGDSALNPARIFSHADSTEQLRVRIDDKLNRIINGGKFPGDDDVKDLTGYLILLMVANSEKELNSEVCCDK